MILGIFIFRVKSYTTKLKMHFFTFISVSLKFFDHLDVTNKQPADNRVISILNVCLLDFKTIFDLDEGSRINWPAKNRDWNQHAAHLEISIVPSTSEKQTSLMRRPFNTIFHKLRRKKLHVHLRLSCETLKDHIRVISSSFSSPS